MPVDRRIVDVQPVGNYWEVREREMAEAIQPALPTVEDILVGAEIVRIEDLGDWITLTTREGFRVEFHIGRVGLVVVHPERPS
jgi:hypothetical protein